MPTSKRLRDLIREIRAARTSAEERAVVNRECADIRDSFREEDNVYRCRNVAKLLYIYMLGYPAHFGQLECLKLIASPKFSDKRIGYLGAMLLLDERTDVHLLVTNSLKNDLNHTTQYVPSLALCTLGSICSAEMSRDLAGEVEKLIKSKNTYLRKKATLCAFRMIRKVPDLMEMFIPCTRSLLNETSHGVLLAAVCLITEMCEKSPDTLNHFRKMVPNILKVLKSLFTTGTSQDLDVNGICDPFLQIKILRLLRILGHGNEESSEAINDIVAQLATNTETSKNVGHAILFEIVVTIMGIESDAGLRVLAVNILGRFLLNTDKNIRYVALKTLQRMIQMDMKAVQRHRSTIVDCLQDFDVSIRRRAMELSFALITTSNVEVMTRELLLFLATGDEDFKADCCSGIALAAHKYAPNTRWHIDTLINVLISAGNHARDDVVSLLASLISETPDLHAYSVHSLFRAVKKDLYQQPLVQVAAWSIGEYGVHLTSSSLPPDISPLPDLEHPLSEDAVLGVLDQSLLSNLTSQSTKQFLITAVMKLSTRFSQPNSILRIRHLISVYSTSTQVELQQRSVEFSALFRQHDHLRSGLLETMPVLTSHSVNTAFDPSKEPSPPLDDDRNGWKDPSDDKPSNILDLLGEEATTVVNGNGVPHSQAPPSSNDLLDLLGGLDLGGPPSNVIPGFGPPSNTIPGFGPPSNTIPGFGSSPATIPGFGPLSTGESQIIDDISTSVSSLPPMTAYQKNGLSIMFHFDHAPGSPSLSIRSIATNTSPSTPIEDLLLQVALPKTLSLSLLPPSGTSLMPSGSQQISQIIKINNPQKNPLRVRLRVQYSILGTSTTETVALDSFSPTLWQ